jgi:hypothetical protein
MQLSSRFLLSALIGVAAASFAALIVGSLLPRFAYSLQVSYLVVGIVFSVASGYAAPKSHRKLIGIILLAFGTVTLMFLDFRGEPFSFLIGGSLGYAFLWFTRRP